MFNLSEYVGNPHSIPNEEYSWMDEASEEYQRRIKIRHHIDETNKYNNILKKLYQTSSNEMQNKIIELMMNEICVGDCYDREYIKKLFKR